MEYDQDTLYLIVDFLEEQLELAESEEDATMFRYTIRAIKTLIKE